MLPKFTYHEPKDVGEALDLMAAYGKQAKPLAGGTDLLVNMKKKLVTPAHIVSIGRIEEMKGLEIRNGSLIIGPAVTVAELAGGPESMTTLSCLREAARGLGSPLVRNLATVGGNICSARPAADLLPALMVYGAMLVLEKHDGDRSVPMEEFFLGPGQTVIEPEEILTEIHLDVPAPGSGSAYLNLGVRKALEINIANVAVFLGLKEDGTIKSARIFMGSVGPTVLRATSAETLLIDEKPNDGLFAQAGDAASEDCQPIDDFRGSAAYRRAMVKVLTKRTLFTAWKRAQAVN